MLDFYRNQVGNYKKEDITYPEIAFKELKNCVDTKLETQNDEQGIRSISFFDDMKQANLLNVYGYTPSLYINSELVRGVEMGDIAASAVCDSFKSPPPSCNDLKVNMINSPLNNPGYITGVFFMVVVCVVLFGLVFLLWKKVIIGQADKDMNEMVNYHLEKYQNANKNDTTI